MPRLLSVIVVGLAGACLRAEPPAKVEFDRDIRPLFVRSCYSCHGPDKQRGGLRLDQKSAALAGGDSGKVIAAGNGKDSLLVKLVSGHDPDRPMPPKGDKLTAAEIGLSTDVDG